MSGNGTADALQVIPAGELNVAILVLYLAQFGFCMFLLTVVDHFPRLLALFFFIAWPLGYPLSYFLDINVYEEEPLSSNWTSSTFKGLLVIYFSTIPTLWFYWTEALESKLFGRYITVILVANIVYTLIFEFTTDAVGACNYLRAAMVFLMCTSLALRLVILESNKKPVVFKNEPNPYSSVMYTPVSNLWALGYLIWNYFFAVFSLGIRAGIQDVLLVIGMGYEQIKYMIEYSTPLVFFEGFRLERTYVDLTQKRGKNDTPDPPSFAWHFGFARALTLGGYFVVSPVVGMLPFVSSVQTSTIVECNTEMELYHGIVVAIFFADLVSAAQAFYDTETKLLLQP